MLLLGILNEKKGNLWLSNLSTLFEIVIFINFNTSPLKSSQVFCSCHDEIFRPPFSCFAWRMTFFVVFLMIAVIITGLCLWVPYFFMFFRWFSC